jgi:hypothetical protein
MQIFYSILFNSYAHLIIAELQVSLEIKPVESGR